MTGSPTLRPHDAICISAIDWDVLWQGPQEIMSRLAGAGSRVIYVENTASRAPRLSDASRVARRLMNRFRDRRIDQPPPAGVTIMSPLVAPYPWSGWARRVNRLLFVRPLRTLANDLCDPDIWVFLPTPAAVDAVRACRRPNSVVIYYCVSDFAQVAEDRDALRKSEAELLEIADLVFVNGIRLHDHFAPLHDRVRIFPYGVSLDAFQPSAGRREPEDVAGLSRPRVGYVGLLHQHLAVDWLVAAATALPGSSFVFVGPRQPDVDLGALEALPNVHLLGARSHGELAAYLAAFDVCLIPYIRSRYTESVVPTKLFEYLAMERPVVSSDIPEVVALPAGVVTTAGDAASFTAAIESATRADNGADARRERRLMAERYSWESSLERMLGEIEAVRAPSAARRHG